MDQHNSPGRFQAAVVALLSALAANACTHAMQVVNLNRYKPSAPPPRRIALALQDHSTNEDERRYFEFIHQALAVEANVVPVGEMDRGGDHFLPERVVRVRPKPTYQGSAWNYFITFPGFLFFTHAWNGYVYGANLDTEVEVTDEGGALIARREISNRYDLRHCSFKRGAWASSGWYTPGYGILDAFIGFFMVGYDPASTEDFEKEVGPSYGRFVARSILEMASAKPLRGDVFVPMPAAAAPPSTAPKLVAPPQIPSAPPVTHPRDDASFGHTAPTELPAQVASKGTMLERLRELKRLHDEGSVADDDYGTLRDRVIHDAMAQ